MTWSGEEYNQTYFLTFGLNNWVGIGWMLSPVGKTLEKKTVYGRWSTNKPKLRFGYDKCEMPVSHPTSSIRFIIGQLLIIDTVKKSLAHK